MYDVISAWISRLFRGDPAAIAVLVEWLIIGLGVYLVLRFLRGTRGASLFRGVALLLLSVTLVVKLVAETFQFERILAIYPKFVFGTFLLALIVFQPELRRALMRLGAAGWLPGLSGDTRAMLDELVESVAYLHKMKIGGLIAIERNTELGEELGGGCKLDAEVTAQLLNTIFWPGSALHDMGVVISNNRVARAAVQFPLTDSESLDPSMGSRHRAAIGLSEETDALVIAVSEETGTISVAEGGRLLRGLTPESLRELLDERLSAPPETPAEAAAAGSESVVTTASEEPHADSVEAISADAARPAA